MPPPKTYNYTINDVLISQYNKRVFFDFRDDSGLFVPSFRENNICYKSYATKKYQDARTRCNPSSKDFNGAEWHFGGFQEFAEWIIKQKFYGFGKYELDKDLFYDGGILRYSPETCCLIPSTLNSSLIDYKDTYFAFEKSRNKFFCRIEITPFGEKSKDFFVGRFDTKEECAEAYRIRKIELVRSVLSESYKDHVDGEVYERLKVWTPKLSRY